MISGIYRITDVVTGRFYIGSSKNIDKRLSEHKNLLKSKKHYNLKMQGTYNKRPDALIYEVEFKCDEEYLLFFEQIYISGLKPAFNNSRIAGRVEFTQEVRDKISRGNKGHPAWNKGVPQTEEAKQRHREFMKGRTAWNKGISTGPESEETKKKKSLARIGRPSNNTGKPRSEMAKEKTRQTLARKKLEKINSLNKGKE